MTDLNICSAVLPQIGDWKRFTLLSTEAEMAMIYLHVWITTLHIGVAQ
jgi:hypothetical protein